MTTNTIHLDWQGINICAGPCCEDWVDVTKHTWEGTNWFRCNDHCRETYTFTNGTECVTVRNALVCKECWWSADEPTQTFLRPMIIYERYLIVQDFHDRWSRETTPTEPTYDI